MKNNRNIPYPNKLSILLVLSLLLGAIIPIDAYAQLEESNPAGAEQSIKDSLMRSNDFWKDKLTPLQFYVAREAGTERPYTGEYDDFYEEGVYECVCCGTELFTSKEKFKSGCGWPSFSDIRDEENIKVIKDYSHGMIREEVRCKKCDAHLGHVFEDGPPPTGLRYCINSASLKFKPKEKGSK